MSITVPVISEDTVRFKDDMIFEFIGKGVVYTYQTIGEGEAVVEVSNDKCNWTHLATFTNTDNCCVAHTWKFQRASIADTLTLTVRRGS